MNTIQRTTVRGLLALVTALILGIAAIAGPVAAQAATTLLMGTTYLPDPMTNPTYVYGATNYYINPTTLCGVQSCTTKPVLTPETFWPFSGLTDPTIDQSILQGTILVDQAIKETLGTGPIVVFGDSQSSSILTHEKLDLAWMSVQDKSQLTFLLLANPNRPNGGMLERFAPLFVPFLGLTASGPTPTDTGIKTIDIALQYDGIADLPMYPLNLLADLNVLAGGYLHGSYMTSSSGYTPTELVAAVNDPANWQLYGDTTYITIPAKQLPLLVPFRTLGDLLHLSAVTTPIADLIEPTLKVLVELGYDRTIPYGQPTRFGLFPKINLPTLVTDLHAAVKQGVHAALADIGIQSGASGSGGTSAAAGSGHAPKRAAAAAGTRGHHGVKATAAGKAASRAGAAARGSAHRSVPHPK